MGTGNIISGEKIARPFMKSKTCHVWIVTQRVGKIVIRGSKLTTAHRKGFGKWNRLFGKTGYPGSKDLCGGISVVCSSIPQWTEIIIAKSMKGSIRLKNK